MGGGGIRGGKGGRPGPPAQRARRIRMRRVIAASAILLALTACPARSPVNRGRVLFVGLDGGDWQYLDRLMDEGAMPNLAGLLREGDRLTIVTQQPPLSPLSLTPMMTGVPPLAHRILH